MSKAIKCDRCGNYSNCVTYKIDDIAFCKKEWSGTSLATYKSEFKPIDLCEDCLKSLGEWFNRGLDNA